MGNWVIFYYFQPHCKTVDARQKGHFLLFSARNVRPQKNLIYPEFENLEMASLRLQNFRPQKILPTPSKPIISTPVPKVKVLSPPPKKKRISQVSINCLQISTATCINFVSGHGVKHIRFLLPYYDEQRWAKTDNNNRWWGILHGLTSF